jgi:hypothetical protein
VPIERRKDFLAIWELSEPVFVGVSIDLTHTRPESTFALNACGGTHLMSKKTKEMRKTAKNAKKAAKKAQKEDEKVDTSSVPLKTPFSTLRGLHGSTTTGSFRD